MKKVKTITIILAIILVTLVAFAGVYIQTQNRMENKVKDYTLSKEFAGSRVVEIGIVKNDSSDEEKSDTNQNTENYKIVKKTIEKRLKNLKAQDYTISLNEGNGIIRVELLEDENTDSYVYYTTASGKVEIKEKDAETELISDSMVEKAKYSYNVNPDGKYQVFMELELNKEGQNKISELSNDYAFLADEIDQIEEEKKSEEDKAKDETSTEETNVENNEETNTENSEEKITKKIAVLTIAGNEYDIDKIEKNKLTVKIGGQTSNSTSINNNMASAAELSMLINSGKFPIDYEIKSNRLEYSDISKNGIIYFALIVLAIIIVILAILSVKYKTQGLLCSISFIGFVALFSLLLRYTNVLISIEGIGAIIFIIAINLKMNQTILSKIQKMNMIKEAIISTYKDMFLKLIPIMIIAITFCFSGWKNLSSFGMIIFWGLILIAIYNISVTQVLLKLRENK